MLVQASEREVPVTGDLGDQVASVRAASRRVIARPDEVESLTRRVGGLVRRLRREMQLSQEAFAECCGLHRTYVGAIERGEKTITIETAGKLADGLGLSLAQLFLQVEQGAGRASEQDVLLSRLPARRIPSQPRDAAGDRDRLLSCRQAAPLPTPPPRAVAMANDDQDSEELGDRAAVR